MMNKLFKNLTVVVVMIFCCSILATAQVTGGAVSGSVVDANGAVIPDAKVVLKDKLRGQEVTAQTTGSGSYQFPNVGVGDYTLTITKDGFASQSREVNVTLNQTTSVDLTLQAAGVAPNVVDVVGGSEAVVQTETSQLGGSFSTRQVLDLPINGNANNLAVLQPNVILPANGTAGSGGVSGGIRSRGNSFNIDGVDNNDVSVTGPTTAPIQDAVQEFTLLQNNFSAEFGSGAGGQFNQITKSGTNEFHGSVFTYIGSQRLNARSTNEDRSLRKNFFKEARWGGTFGGPLPFFNFGENDGPMFISGRNKLFFFGAFEKYYQEGAAAGAPFFSPTAAGMAQLAGIAGVSPFVLNIFNQNVALAPAADRTVNVLGNAIPFGPVILPVPAFQEQKSYQFNIDHLPNEKNQFRYRYARSRYSAEQAGNGGLAFNNLSVYNTDSFSMNWIRSFSTSLINDLRLGYQRLIQDFPLKNDALANFPNLTVTAQNLLVGPNGNLPQSGFDNNYQVYDSLTWIRGSHTIKFGGEMKRYIGGSDFLPRSRGDYSYASFEQLALDQRPTVVNIKGIGSGAFISNYHRWYGFVQDDWKIGRNLTLNLGVRYEYQGLFRDSALQATAANANVPGVIEFGVPKVDKNNFAPRLGFAWAPHWDNWVGNFLFGNQGQSSIRGNFARAFFANFSNFNLISLPPTLQGELQGAGNATNFLATGGAGTAPFIPNTTPAFLRGNAASFILEQTVAYADSFSFSYQRELGSVSGMEIRYLRTRGKKLPVQVQLNTRTVVDSAMIVPTFTTLPSAAAIAALPTIATIAANNPSLGAAPFQAPRQLGPQGFNGALTGFPAIGSSEYDGVAFSATRRFAKNLGFTAAYTWSKTRDNSTNELNTSALNPRRAADAGEYFGGGLNVDTEWGPSPLDIPHRFVTSFNYDLPFFRNSSNGFLKAVFGGLSFAGIYQIQSGQPVTVLTLRDANRNGDAAGERAIFNAAGNPNISSGIRGVTIDGGGNIVLTTVGAAPDPNVRAYVAINPNAGYISTGFFARELANNGAGLARRNSFRTQGLSNTDLNILKNTRFGRDGRYNIQIGAEIFDLFNQREQTINGVGAQTAAFAQAGNDFFNNYSVGTYGGRTITMRAKFIF